MDDILSGAGTMEEALKRQDQLVKLCRAGGFPLKKWAANSPELLENIAEEDRMQAASRAWSPQESTHSTLGLLWNPEKDYFSFASKTPQDRAVTKRSILSQTAQLFDPLGWLAPTIIYAKITIQSTWLLGLDWDDPLLERETTLWRQFQTELPLLADLKIPRALAKGSASSLRTLHGFADASERAYAAVIYLKSREEDQDPVITLIAAKSKVAPVKQVTLPRLELCAAMLLARLVSHSVKVLNLHELPAYLWTDSMMTLGWIQGHPSRWKTYVANRVAEIQRLAPEARWNHLPGSCNPADCASRGLLPSALVNHELWWKGSPFLHEPTSLMIKSPAATPEECGVEQRVNTMTATTSAAPEEHPLLTKFSILNKLLRVTAWCRRWLPERCHGKAAGAPNPERNRCRPLTAMELDEAEKLWIRWNQKIYFRKEISLISASSRLPSKSSLSGLNPSLDQEGLLRVGVRIKHAPLQFDEKHPVILPPQSNFTKLVIEACHRRSLHGALS
ncbi:integrase core domain protein [Lasius niger]|uniref:Integrase core domain protein n=1 Tax=Lasius niger TaxID=67767 RepID=A0A0J7K5S7_LASNI|nr:integrase core domain protein [Lasius niger]